MTPAIMALGGSRHFTDYVIYASIPRPASIAMHERIDVAITGRFELKRDSP